MSAPFGPGLLIPSETTAVRPHLQGAYLPPAGQHARPWGVAVRPDRATMFVQDHPSPEGHKMWKEDGWTLHSISEEPVTPPVDPDEEVWNVVSDLLQWIDSGGLLAMPAFASCSTFTDLVQEFRELTIAKETNDRTSIEVS